MKKIVSLLISIVMILSMSVSVMGASRQNDDITVVLKNYTNSFGAFISEEEVDFDVKPQIINGRTMVPIRAVAEELGWKVEWNGDKGIVLLKGAFIPESAKHLSEYNFGQKRYVQANSLLDLYAKLNSDLVVNENTGDTHIGSLPNWGYLVSAKSMLSDGGDLKDYKDRSAKIVCAEIAIDTTMEGPHPYLELAFCDYYSVWYNEGKNILSSTSTEMGLEVYTYGMDVGATIIDGRTLLPLRAITESMGADVSWNDKTRTVTIDFGGSR